MILFTDRSLPLDILDEPAAALRESIDPAALGDLADDIAVNGVLQPIGARGPDDRGHYEVVWGHRRTLAARMAGLTEIPARICATTYAPELARIAENFHRVDLNPREEARAVASLLAQGKPRAECARILRRSLTWVESRIELQTWPDDLQDGVARGELTMSSARILAQVDHDNYRGQLIDEAKRIGANANTVSLWAAHYVVDRERIIRNTDTIEAITSRRETFVVLCDCEVCRTQIDTRDSAIIRVCPNCKRILNEQQHEETAAPTG